MRKPDLRVPYLKALWYGQPGSTKTRTAATACDDPRTAPVLWLDVMGNPQSIRMNKNQPDMISLDSLGDLNEPFDFLINGQDPNHPLAKDFDLHPPYKTVVVDGITEIQRYSIRRVTGTTKIGPGDIPNKVERQHFGAILQQMLNFADLFYKLDMNVIFTALEWARDDGGSTIYVPNLMGQAVEQVPAYALLVGRMVTRNKVDKVLIAQDDTLRADETVSVMLVTPGGRYYAKDQYLMGVDYFVNPTVSDLLDAIQKSGEVRQPNTNPIPTP